MALLLIALVLMVPATLASCDGFNVTSVRLMPCRNRRATNLLKLTNVTTTLQQMNGKCELVPEGCTEAVKAFTTTKIIYNATKDHSTINIKGVVDVCKNNNVTSAMSRLVVAILGSQCSGTAGTICQHQTVDFTNQTHSFKSIRGKWGGTVQIQNDSGNSCYRFATKISMHNKRKLPKRNPKRRVEK